MAANNRLDELTVIEGDTRELDPGDRVVLSATETLVEGRIAGRVATRGVNIFTNVTATPVDEEGDRLADVTAETSVLLIADEDESLPGFADALGAGVGALLLIGGVLLLVVGAVLPFIPLVSRWGSASGYVGDSLRERPRAIYARRQSRTLEASCGRAGRSLRGEGQHRRDHLESARQDEHPHRGGNRRGR